MLAAPIYLAYRKRDILEDAPWWVLALNPFPVASGKILL